ncbi:hypothetical protein DL93DRAFT_2120778 [Clavulina sp. PMI_390]|nr:hypothetical protein DL93DRAFT_2120778 [Clavulina sp. PMI_390]
MSQPPPHPSSSSPERFAKYRDALQALSKSTRTPLSSLVVSFAVLHEVTAIVPVVGLFYACRALNAGPTVVDYVATHQQNMNAADGSTKFQSSVLNYAGDLVEQGQTRATRFARRYGLWGKEGASQEQNAEVQNTIDTRSLAGDLANAALAYGATKALFPARIAASLYFAPAFSRRIVDPIRLSRTRWRKS